MLYFLYTLGTMPPEELHEHKQSFRIILILLIFLAVVGGLVWLYQKNNRTLSQEEKETILEKVNDPNVSISREEALNIMRKVRKQ